MAEYPPFRVYSQLPAFFKRRGLTPRANDLGRRRDVFAAEIGQFDYVLVGGEGPGGETTLVFIFSAGAKHMSKSPALRDLLGRLDAGPEAEKGQLAEVILVGDEAALAKAKITAVVTDFRDRPPDRFPRPPARNPVYHLYPYSTFVTEIPHVLGVGVYRVLSAAETRATLAREHLLYASLKTIPDTDAAIVWTGARPGQVVEIQAPSEITGVAWDLWRVISGGVAPFPM